MERKPISSSKLAQTIRLHATMNTKRHFIVVAIVIAFVGTRDLHGQFASQTDKQRQIDAIQTQINNIRPYANSGNPAYQQALQLYEQQLARAKAGKVVGSTGNSSSGGDGDSGSRTSAMNKKKESDSSEGSNASPRTSTSESSKKSNGKSASDADGGASLQLPSDIADMGSPPIDQSVLKAEIAVAQAALKSLKDMGISDSNPGVQELKDSIAKAEELMTVQTKNEPASPKPSKPLPPDPANPWTIPGAMWSQKSDGSYEYYQTRFGPDGKSYTTVTVPYLDSEKKLKWRDP